MGHLGEFMRWRWMARLSSIGSLVCLAFIAGCDRNPTHRIEGGPVRNRLVSETGKTVYGFNAPSGELMILEASGTKRVRLFPNASPAEAGWIAETDRYVYAFQGPEAGRAVRYEKATGAVEPMPHIRAERTPLPTGLGHGLFSRNVDGGFSIVPDRGRPVDFPIGALLRVGQGGVLVRQGVDVQWVETPARGGTEVQTFSGLADVKSAVAASDSVVVVREDEDTLTVRSTSSDARHTLKGMRNRRPYALEAGAMVVTPDGTVVFATTNGAKPVSGLPKTGDRLVKWSRSGSGALVELTHVPDDSQEPHQTDVYLITVGESGPVAEALAIKSRSSGHVVAHGRLFSIEKRQILSRAIPSTSESER